VRTHLWHVTQQAVENDAGVVVTMNVSRCPELVTFLLGFGPDCEVLEPPKLREEIATGRGEARRGLPTGRPRSRGASIGLERSQSSVPVLNWPSGSAATALARPFGSAMAKLSRPPRR